MRPPVRVQICDRHIRLVDGARTHLGERLSTNSRHADVSVLVAEVLRLLGPEPTKRRVLLSVPASWCLVHAIDVAARRPSFDMLAFALEDFLPVDLEIVTTGFVRISASRWLGAALETRPVRALLDQLANANVLVDEINIDVLDVWAAADDLVAWCDEEHVVTWAAAACEMRVIRLAPDLEPAAWLDAITAVLKGLGSPAPRITGPLDAARSAAIRSACGAPSDERESGRASSRRLNLARAALSPPSAPADRLRRCRNAGLAISAASLLFAAGLLVSREQRMSQVREIDAWQAAAYRQVFRGPSAPAGVRLRVASERRRLEALTLATPSPSSMDAPDALAILRIAVAALPDHVRVDLQELRIDGVHVLVRGRAREHADAERIAQAIDATPLLACGKPRTDRAREGGVQFTLAAECEGPRPGGETVP